MGICNPVLMLAPVASLLLVLSLWLLAGFSPNQELLSTCCESERPIGWNGGTIPGVAPVVKVSMGSISVNGQLAKPLGEPFNDDETDHDVGRLLEGLLRVESLRLAETHPSVASWDACIIDMDKALPVGFLKRVMLACRAAGLSNIHLAVNQPTW